MSALFSSDTEGDRQGFRLSGVCEVINADSVQVYKGMRLGSAAPGKEITEKLPHHLVGEVNPDEEFSTAHFVKRADVLCKDIFARKKLPVLSGGTAFFLKNFIYGLPVTPTANIETRKFLKNRLHTEGAAVLLNELKGLDPVTAEKLHINDEYRILRALEVYADSGKPLSFFASPQEERCEYAFMIISLERPRSILYERIDSRVEKMFEDGLYDEFKTLYGKGYGQNSPGFKAIGYKEFFEVNPENPLEADLEKVKALIKRNTKRYAKRQETFFKKIPNAQRINMEENEEIRKLTEIVLNFYNIFFTAS